MALNTGLPRSPSGTALGLTAVAAALALAALPTFMVGGLAVQIRADIGLSETQLGAAVTLGFLVSALIGPAGGRLSDRLGARRSVLTGCLVSSLAMAGIGLSAEGFWSLALALMVAGAALALIDPGLAILITSVAPPGRQGLAFGIKEASIPAATLAAGIAVPAVALSHGWRWAFLVGLVPLVAVLAIVPQIRIDRNRPGKAVEPVSTPPRHGLLVVAGATAAASTAASGVSVFLTESAVAMGNSPETAGVLLAVGSIAGIASRMGAGAFADRHDGPQLSLIAVMLAVGAGCMAVVAIAGSALLVLGTVGAFAAGWGWSGILFLSLVRLTPATPGAAAGIGLAGLAIGNAVGPLAFGAVAQYSSFGLAWGAGAALMLAAALAMRRAQSILEIHYPASPNDRS